MSWQDDYKRATAVNLGVWYRSPLWDHDHMLGRTRDHKEEKVAWCGRALEAARTMDNELGGLWLSERKTGKCSECRRREKEWQEDPYAK